jgi:hypothetical protein
VPPIISIACAAPRRGYPPLGVRVGLPWLGLYGDKLTLQVRGDLDSFLETLRRGGLWHAQVGGHHGRGIRQEWSAMASA